VLGYPGSGRPAKIQADDQARSGIAQRQLGTVQLRDDGDQALRPSPLPDALRAASRRTKRFRTCSSISGRSFHSFGTNQRGVTRVVASPKSPHREIVENERLHEFAVLVAMRGG
jgi:hypothetical protein